MQHVVFDRLGEKLVAAGFRCEIGTAGVEAADFGFVDAGFCGGLRDFRVRLHPANGVTPFGEEQHVLLEVA